MGRQDYHWQHEPCLYGWKKGASHFWNADRKQTTVMNFDKPHKNKEHPTMKPVDLIQYQMSNSSKPNHIILDTFGGSGTTLIAAERIQRQARLVELDPRYCDVIIKRWDSEFIYLQAQGGLPINCFYHVYAARKDVNPLHVEYQGESWKDYPDPNYKHDAVNPRYDDPKFSGPPNTITI